MITFIDIYSAFRVNLALDAGLFTVDPNAL